MRFRPLALGGGVVVLLLAGGGLLLAGPLTHGSAAPPSPSPAATATVERRTLQATTRVNGTLGYAPSYIPGAAAAYLIGNGVATTGGADPAGLLAAYAQAQMGFDSAVQSLAALERPTATSTAQAEAQLAQVQSALTAAQQSAAGPTPKELAQAEAQLAQAQAGVTQAEQAAQGPTAAQTAQAQATLAQAQANLLQAQDRAQGPSAAQTAQAQAQVTQAGSTLTADQAALATAATAYTACLNPSAPAPSPTGSPAPTGSPSPTTAPSAAPTPVPCDGASLQLAVQQAQAKVSADEANLSSAQAALAALSSPQAQAEAQANLTSAQQQVAAAQASLDALTSDQAKVQAQANLTSAQAAATAAQASLDALTSSATKAEARAQLAAAQAQVHAAQTALYALSHPTSEQLTQAKGQVSTARVQLDAAKTKLDAPSGVVTQLAQVGATVKPGGVLYTLDGSCPVVLLMGSTPAWRTLQAGVANGPDVRELEENLQALGYAPTSMKIDDHWDSGTTAAVQRWQQALGVAQTGVIPYGEVVFEPGPLRVTTDTAAPGSTVQAGAAVLQATSTTQVVDVPLDPALQASVRVGDAVSITLPDGSTTRGTVSYVASVATQTSGSGSAGSTPPPTITVEITLDDPAAAGSLDQAPVTVNITTATATDVLAVPVTALLAQPGGGYTVEVVRTDGTHRLVPVTTGIFDDAQGLVQVSGPQLAAGQSVVVAST